MKKNYLLQAFMFVLFLSHLFAFSKEGIDPTSKIIDVRSNTFKSSTNPGWSYTCDDGIEVELLSLGLKNNVPASLTISDIDAVERIIVEIVYKSKNPGNSIEILDADGNSYTALREVPSGGRSDVWYYRTELPATSKINYSNSTNSNHAQSILAYVFRKKNNGTASSGFFTALSGYNNIQTINIPIQKDSGPRTVIVQLPISELTPDGRYIHIEVSAADGSFTELTEIINDFPSGTCCIKVFELSLNDVAGSIDEIEIKVDTRNKKNGQNVSGQSWVMGGAIKTNVRCSCVEFDTEMPTADNLIDHIILEDISQLPDVTFSDSCSKVTIEYNEYISRESCEIDFGPVYADSNIWFYSFPFNNLHHWNRGFYLQFLDGSTKVNGTILNNSEPDSGWDAEINFEAPVNYTSWINSGGQTANDNQKEQRMFANIDFSKPYRLNGFGNYKNSDLSLVSTTNLHYMDIGPRDVYGDYGIGMWSSYEGMVNSQIVGGESLQHIKMIASLKKCVRARDGADLLVREWLVTDAAGNTRLFVQRVELEWQFKL